MARSLQQIQSQIYESIAASPELSAKLTSTSNTAVWRLWVYVVAFVLFIHESLWDVHAQELEERIAATRVHNQKWYRDIALNYQHGYALNDSDVYDNSGLTDEQIAASKIIANAAVVKLNQNGYGVLRIKVVKLSGDEYAPLTIEELTGFKAYMNLVADAGTTIVATSTDADLLKAEIDIYYNPQVLSPTGARLDGTDDEPVQNAIRAYLKSQQFNGRLVRRYLEDHIQTVPGVLIPNIVKLWTKYGSYNYEDDVANVGLVNEIRTPDSGYLKLDEITINWIAPQE